MLDEFGVKLCVMGDLDGTWGRQQIAQGCERISVSQVAAIAIAESIEVNDVDAFGRRQLDQSQASGIRIKLGGFGVESYCLVGR
jgi:hypothetical protein